MSGGTPHGSDRAEREAERLARLPEGFVAGDDGGARDRHVLIGADRVERGAGPERHAPSRERQPIERRPQPDAVDFAEPFGGDDRHDRVGEGDGQEPLLLVGGKLRHLDAHLRRPGDVPRSRRHQRLRQNDRRAVRQRVRHELRAADRPGARAIPKDVPRQVARPVQDRQTRRERLAEDRVVSFDLVEGDPEIGRTRPQAGERLVPRRHQARRGRNRLQHLVVLHDRRGQRRERNRHRRRWLLHRRGFSSRRLLRGRCRPGRIRNRNRDRARKRERRDDESCSMHPASLAEGPPRARKLAHHGNHSRGIFCQDVGRRGSPSGSTSEPTKSACSYTLPIDRAMLSRSMSLTTPLLVAL